MRTRLTRLLNGRIAILVIAILTSVFVFPIPENSGIPHVTVASVENS